MCIRDRHARVIMRQVDHLKHDFQEQADGDAGHIRIFANTTAVTEFMPDILAQFLAGHPGVTIDLQERLTRDIVRGVLDGTTDLGIEMCIRDRPDSSQPLAMPPTTDAAVSTESLPQPK